MKQTIIENPILNSPFIEPTRHFKFSDEGITNETIETRRTSSYFIPVAQPKKKGKQLSFNTEWTQDRIEENKFINQVRAKVTQWRLGKYQDITKTTSRLLEYWNNPERERKLFFCQIEVLETIIYITEVANKYGDAWTEAREKGLTPPVFIVVCNNTNVSKLVFDYIAGWEKSLPDESTVMVSVSTSNHSQKVKVPGKLPLFSNVENGQWTFRPNTILIDSE